jgi:hypothetical protein
MIRRALLALSLLATLVAPAFAQAPPPIPALPDSARITNYTISATTCACAVGFQIYGDQTDVDNWIQVFLNGTRVLSTDATFGWTLTSPSGSLGVIPRPITDGVVTFNSTQTGTVQIVGAQRPRRLSEFAENVGVTAHSFNLLQNTVFAELRENWDKIINGGGGGSSSLTIGSTPISGGTNGDCLTVSGSVLGQASCGGGGGGAVSSVSNSDGTLTISPTTGSVVASLASPTTYAKLNAPDQTVSGGANVTSQTLSTGSFTIDCGSRPLQYITNGGAFTITAPSNDGSCLLLITNNASAGAVTFSGFSVGSNTGDALTTTNGNKFTVDFWRINGTSGYRIAAHQ